MHLTEYVRLSKGGLLLNETVYQEQRDAANNLQRGLTLVLLIGLLIGAAGMIGQIGEMLATRDWQAIHRTVYDGLTAMPWYQNANLIMPDFQENFKALYDDISLVLGLLMGGGLLRAVLTLVLSPVLLLLNWSIYGLFMHRVARLFGGGGTLRQTLSCTALATSANLLALVQIIPFAQVSGVLILSLIANYIAIRQAHDLPPRRAFWTVMLPPALLLILAVVLAVVVIVMLPGSSQ